MTANVISYRGAARPREIGKTLNFSPSIIDRFSHLFANGDFPHTLELESQIEQAGLPKVHRGCPAFIRLYHADLRLAAASWPAFRRHDYLPKQAQFICALENASMRVESWHNGTRTTAKTSAS